MIDSALTVEEVERYSRQLILKGWSEETQLNLRSLSVAIPSSLPSCALYLAAAGVGQLAIYGESGESLVSQLKEFNPNIEVKLQVEAPAGVDALVVGATQVDGSRVQLNFALGNDARTVSTQIPQNNQLPQSLFSGIIAASFLINWVLSGRQVAGISELAQ